MLDTYNETFPNDIASEHLLKKPIVKIDYVRNNNLIREEFNILEGGLFSLYTCGQVTEELTNIKRVGGRDYIDIFMISPDNNKIRCWQSFYYHYYHPHGRKGADMNFPFSCQDINSSSYRLEIQLPWSEINRVNEQKCSLQGTFSFFDADIDPYTHESSLSTSPDLTVITLANKIPAGKLENIYALKTNIKPIIDGKVDSIWEHVPFQQMKVINSGITQNTDDASCYYRVLWDDENLYLLFKIVDQAKTFPYVITQDFCRIINKESGELIWQSSDGKTDKYPFYFKNDKIKLKKGKYILEYQSDHNISFSDWNKFKMPASFYGAYLYSDD